MQKTLGGDRLGSGKKMKVDLHGYERSTHDLSYLWRSTMSAGTLVPFMSELALPGDTFDINLNCEILTHPTIGPLFGSYKVQLDVFLVPIRLYNGALHNNKLGIGLEMSNVYFPVLQLDTPQNPDWDDIVDKDNSQINPSCLLKYLGISGAGLNDDVADTSRFFNAIPFIAYWDIYKNYYANKQEEIGAYIRAGADKGGNISAGTVNGTALPNVAGIYVGATSDTFRLEWQSATAPNLEYVIFNTSIGEIPALELATWTNDTVLLDWVGAFKAQKWGQLDIYSFRIAGANDSITVEPQVDTFPLENLDQLREEILMSINLGAAFNVSDYVDGASLAPYDGVARPGNRLNRLSSQEGLGLKTYQSDILNNWLRTEYIDNINATTAISTALGSITIDQIQLSKKVYDLLNRVAVSGGTYRDWIQTVYDQDKFWEAETPMYMGGLIKELVFQEVIANAASEGQELGTLAGKGILSKKHKGGEVYIRVEEPSYIMGIISLTPRCDYSQGNKWDVHLMTMDDLHKPGLDGIGFQDLITEQHAWWSTYYQGGDWVQRSAGKQPAWLNYMTNVNRVYGNFAIESNEMFMTLNRRYEVGAAGAIGDLTTYIDPTKFNFIFAQTALDAQNFWAQVAVNITARRKMSAKLMPNL